MVIRYILDQHRGCRRSLTRRDSINKYSAQWVCNGQAAAYCSGGTQIYGTTSQWNGSRLQQQSDTVLNQAVSYGYGDGFNRLTSRTVTSGTPQNYTYTYDLSGNRLSQTPLQGGFTFNAAYSTTTNQITTSGYTYDAAGNMTNDAFHSYKYDAEGNILQVDGGTTAQYVYDVFNRRIHVQTPSATTEYIYDYAGRRISSWLSPNNTGNEGRIYWDGQQIGYRSSDRTTYFEHQDTLGAERLRSTFSGGVGSSYFSLPWGDGYTATLYTSGADQDKEHFAGTEHDAESDTEHAQFRNYTSAQGRWLAPDSYMGSYDLTNPQSLNRYAYVLNNPVTFTDPSGLDVFLEDENGWTGNDTDNPPPPCALTDLFGNCVRPLLPPSNRELGNPIPQNNAGLGMDSPGSSPANPPGLGQPQPGCEFGACGSNFQNPVAVGAGAAVCIEAEPCGVIGGIILGGGILYQIWKGTHSQPTIEASSPQERRLLDWVAKAFCVDRKALGDAIHREKIGRPKGKGSDLTLDEIKDLARYLPKIPGCTPTAF
jgi:RHS repeat-associated protein